MSREVENYVKGGTLYICGTPIGNLDDITVRALKILEGVDIIAAEDTRRTIKLLNYYDIDNKLESYHEHNESQKTFKLIECLQEGKSVAVVSDAGMPGISDPGFKIVKTALEYGIEVIPIPGPTAAINALVVSGLDTSSFVFEGFLPRRGKEREEKLNDIVAEQRTIIIYESPYRLKDTLSDLKEMIPERRAAVVRELTKMHEEKKYGNIEELYERIEEVKGEIVLIIEGNKNLSQEEGWEDMSIIEHVKLLMEKGLSKKKAVKKVAEVREIPKKDVYKEAIAINVNK
ncbi:MAG: 16S rRNA (cytidine(1402)-2'-O)-methyltransferase [Bacillota bacterium]